MKNILLFILLLLFYIRPPLIEGKTLFPRYPQNPFIIKLDPSQSHISAMGGIIVSDLNNDGLLDYIISSKENRTGNGVPTICAYDHNGKMLWIQNHADIILTQKAEDNGLPGSDSPGISSADVDGDGKVEIIYLNTKSEIVILNGKTGAIKKKIFVSLPNEGYFEKFLHTYDMLINGSIKRAAKVLLFTPQKWSHFQIVNLRGEHDDEIILQADPLPFRWLKAVSLNTGEVLWEYNNYVGLQHGGVRAADMDDDGFDEVVGAVMIDQDGSTMNQWNYRRFSGHFDSLFIRDILPDKPGLEWILLEEGQNGDDRTALLNKDGVVFYHSFQGNEPQNAAIGEFDLEKPGLEIWLRSRFNKDQRPWVIDSSGNTITSYSLNSKKPKNWSDEGIEFIYTIDWDGGSKKLLAAKERHQHGKIAIIDPLTGEFVRWWHENAARIYVVDVAGDYREEIVVINSKENEIRIYWNDRENKEIREERYWDENYYKRQKLNYNYYSP